MKLRKGVSWEALVVVVKMKSMKVILFFLLILLTRLYARPLHYPHFKLKATYEPPTALPSILEVRARSSLSPNLHFWPSSRKEAIRKIIADKTNLNWSTLCQHTSISPTPSHQHSSTTHTPLITSTCSLPTSTHHTTTVVHSVTSRPSTSHTFTATTHMPTLSTKSSPQSSHHTSTVITDKSSTHTVTLQQSTKHTSTITPTTHIPSFSTSSSPHSTHSTSTVKTDKSSMHTVASSSTCRTNTSMTHMPLSNSSSQQSSHLTSTTKTEKSSTHATFSHTTIPQTSHHTTAVKAEQSSTHTVTSETLKSTTLTTHLLATSSNSLPHSSHYTTCIKTDKSSTHSAMSQRLSTHTSMTTSTIDQRTHTISTKYSSPSTIPTTTSTHRSTGSYSCNTHPTIKSSTYSITNSEHLTTSCLKSTTVLGTTTNKTPSSILSTAHSIPDTRSAKTSTTFTPTSTQSSKFESSTFLSTTSFPSISTSPCTSSTFVKTTNTSTSLTTFTPPICTTTREISTSPTSFLSTSIPTTCMSTSASLLTTVASCAAPVVSTKTSKSTQKEETTEKEEKIESTTISTDKRHGDVYNLMIVFPLSQGPETKTSLLHPITKPSKFVSPTSLDSYTPPQTTSTLSTWPIFKDTTNEKPHSTLFITKHSTSRPTTRQVCKHTLQRSLIFNKLFASPYPSYAIYSNSTTKKQNYSSPMDFVDSSSMNSFVMSLSEKGDLLEYGSTSCIDSKSTISYSNILPNRGKISFVRTVVLTSVSKPEYTSTEPPWSSTIHRDLTLSKAPLWATTPLSADVRRFWPIKWNGLERMLTPGKALSPISMSPTITLQDIWNLEQLKFQLPTEEQPSSSLDEDNPDESSTGSPTPQPLDVTSLEPSQPEEQLPRFPNLPALISHFFGESKESNTSDTVEFFTSESGYFEITPSNEITLQDLPSTDIQPDPDLVYEDIT